jgi:hypothetical protein
MDDRTGGLQREVAFAGRRIKQKVCLALLLPEDPSAPAEILAEVETV